MSENKTSKSIETISEDLLFRSRWLLAPFYGGLVITIAFLLLKFFQEFFVFLPNFLDASIKEVILQILLLVDLTLLSNLLIIIIFSGYETFVSKIHNEHHEDRPSWMGKVDFSELKIKLFGSIVAISGIELLKAFMLLDKYTNEQLAWLVGIHLTFVVSGLLFTYMDKVSAQTRKIECDTHQLEKATHLVDTNKH